MLTPKRRSSASLLNSLFHFFFFAGFCICFCIVLFLLFFIDQKCAALLSRTKMVSIGYFDNEGKIWDPSLVKEMKMKNKNLVKKPYSQGRHLPPKLSNDGSANFVSTFFSSSKLFWKMVSADLSHNERKRWWKSPGQ